MNRYLGLAGLAWLFALGGAFGQTATLLPNATQTFTDNNGQPLSNGNVYFYQPGTTNPQTTWTNPAATVAQPNPVPLGTAGRPASPIYGTGSYRQILKDQFGNTIWDYVTASTGGSSGGGSSGVTAGDGNAVGTVLLWTGTTLPTNYLYTAGQAVSRTTYPALLTAITYSQTALCQAGIASITVPVATSDGTPIGAAVEASCFAPGTTVIAKSSGQLTMSSNATATTSTTLVVFPWGNGDGATTFNVPDYRGRVPTGRDNMNSSIAGILTSTYYGTNPDALGAEGGAQSVALGTSNLPPYTPAGTLTIAGTATTGNPAGPYNNTFGAGSQYLWGSSSSTTTSPLNIATETFTGTPQGGTSVAFATIQPSVTSDYIIKAQANSIIPYVYGFNVLAPSMLATTGALPNSPVYANGTAGIGATLTAGSNSTLTVDGTAAPLGTVVLVANQASAFQNGVYTVTTAGSGSAPWILTRASYFNTTANMLAGSYTFVTGGITQAQTGWVLQAAPTTVGTSAVNFVLFSSAQLASLIPGSTTIAPFTNGGILYDNNGVLEDSTALPNSTTATTQALSDNSTKIATTGFVQDRIGTAIITPAIYGAAANALTANDALTIAAGSAALTTAASHFASTDCQTGTGCTGTNGNKLLSIPGVGPYASTIAGAAVTAGSGYTNGTQTLTVSGGTCSVQPTLLVTVLSNAVYAADSVTNPGNCTVQPANPVSVTGGGGSGATFNLNWGPLATTISGYISPTSVTLAANSSLTLSGTSKTFMWGSNDQAAIQAAINAARTASSTFGAASVQLCGNYAVAGTSGYALNAFNIVGRFSFLGVCPGSHIYYAGAANYYGLGIGGTGTSTASTTLSGNASHGAQTISLTSATGFAVGNYITITCNTAAGGVAGETNKIIGLSGTTAQLQSALAFDCSTSYTTAVVNFAVAEYVTLKGIDFDGTYAAFGATAMLGVVAEFISNPQIDINTANFSTFQASGFQTFGTYGGSITVRDVGSGAGSQTNALAAQYTSNANVTFQASNSAGFGAVINESSRNELHIRVNSTGGRGIKLTGAASNWGFLSATNTPAGQGWTVVDFSGGTSYNHFATVIAEGGTGANGGACFETNGINNLYNIISDLSVANCATPVAINSGDTGTYIPKVTYGANASASNNGIGESTAIVSSGVFVGASGGAAGVPGIVPPIAAGQQNYVLQGAGWASLPAAISGVYPLGQSHIPFVLVSSGTMGNNGALSGVTTLPKTYANAYVYFPSGAISSGSAAGWYYAVFSSATAATIYNNTYTSGTPAIPGTPTPFVTTGPGSFTQTTGAHITSYSLPIAGNTIGANGAIRITGVEQYSNTSTTKTLEITYGGTEFGVNNMTTANSGGFIGGFANAATNVQVPVQPAAMTTVASSSGLFYGSVDSTSNQSLNVTLELVTAATDFLVYEGGFVELIPGVP